MDESVLCDIFKSCFEPSVASDVATVLTGVRAGETIRGIFTEQERSATVGRGKVRSGFCDFVVDVKDAETLTVEDLVTLKSRHYKVYSVDDEVVGMVQLTLLEVAKVGG